jgi:hypothetical protein
MQRRLDKCADILFGISPGSDNCSKKKVNEGNQIQAAIRHNSGINDDLGMK